MEDHQGFIKKNFNYFLFIVLNTQLFCSVQAPIEPPTKTFAHTWGLDKFAYVNFVYIYSLAKTICPPLDLPLLLLSLCCFFFVCFGSFAIHTTCLHSHFHKEGMSSKFVYEPHDALQVHPLHPLKKNPLPRPRTVNPLHV